MHAFQPVAGRRIRAYRTDIHHAPWRIRPAEARLTTNTMAQAAGIRLPERAPLLHYAERQDTLVWLPRAVAA